MLLKNSVLPLVIAISFLSFTETCAEKIGDNILVAMGFGQEGDLKSVELVDFQNNKVCYLGDALNARLGHVGFVSNENKAILCGGYHEFSIKNDCQMLNQNGSFSMATSMVRPRDRAALSNSIRYFSTLASKR